MEQERKEFEAIWLGKGDVLSSSDDARNLTETIVAKTGFVVPAGDVRAWLTACTQLPRALDWIYKHHLRDKFQQYKKLLPEKSKQIIVC